MATTEEPAWVVIDAGPIIHRDEISLSLCLRLNVASLLSDDTAARQAATSLGIKSHGTLGLLIRAARRQLRGEWQI